MRHLKKSEVISQNQIKEILMKQIDLIENNSELLTHKLIPFNEHLETIIDNPETMYIVVDLSASEFPKSLMQGNKDLTRKIEAIKNPSLQICNSFAGTEFPENVQLALLVKKALEVESVSLECLGKEFSFTPSENSLKNTQKLIMKAIQLNLLKATIDKKSQKVFFKSFKKKCQL